MQIIKNTKILIHNLIKSGSQGWAPRYKNVKPKNFSLKSQGDYPVCLAWRNVARGWKNIMEITD